MPGKASNQEGGHSGGTSGEAARNAAKLDKMIVKKVRPWVKLSLAFSAVALTYGCARQFNIVQDRVKVVKFDLDAIEEQVRREESQTQ